MRPVREIVGDCVPYFVIHTLMIAEDKIRTWLGDSGLDVEFFLVDLVVSKENKIRIYLDNQQGITIDECVQISRFLESRLDEQGYIFELEVSSPGLDMPFKVPQQFEKNLGNPVQATMYNGTKKSGKLLAYDGETVGLEVTVSEKIKGKRKKQKRVSEEIIALKDIKTIKRIISF